MSNYFCNYDYQSENKNYEVCGGVCFSKIRGLAPQEGGKTEVYINVDYSDIEGNSFPHTEKEMIAYLAFLKECGLPTSYEGVIQIETFDTEWGEKKEGTERNVDVYCVSVSDDEMINATHRLTTLTAVRYLYEDYYVDVPQLVLKLKDKLDWDVFEILMLSEMLSEKHWGKNTGRTAVHGLIPKAAKLQTKEEFFKALNRLGKGDKYVNDTVCDKGRLNYSRKQSEELFELHVQGKYDEIRNKLS